MQRLRTARHFARLVLAWFALAVGAAVASPVLQPQAVQWLCTGTGAMKLLVGAGADGEAVPQAATLDCPLCATPGAPPAQAHPASGCLLAVPLAPRHGGPAVASRRDLPPPARGPPSLALS